MLHRAGELLRIRGSPSVFSSSIAAGFLPPSTLPEGVVKKDFGRLGAAVRGPSAARSRDTSPVASEWHKQSSTASCRWHLQMWQQACQEATITSKTALLLLLHYFRLLQEHCSGMGVLPLFLVGIAHSLIDSLWVLMWAQATGEWPLVFSIHCHLGVKIYICYVELAQL